MGNGKLALSVSCRRYRHKALLLPMSLAMRVARLIRSRLCTAGSCASAAAGDYLDISLVGPPKLNPWIQRCQIGAL